MGLVPHFLAYVGVPHLRRQAVAKSFECDTAGHHTEEWLSTLACPTSAAPRSAWDVEDATMHQCEAALAGPPQVSVASLLKTTGFTAMRHFEYRDGDLGLGLSRNLRQGGWINSASRNEPPHNRCFFRRDTPQYGHPELVAADCRLSPENIAGTHPCLKPPSGFHIDSEAGAVLCLENALFSGPRAIFHYRCGAWDRTLSLAERSFKGGAKWETWP